MKAACAFLLALTVFGQDNNMPKSTPKNPVGTGVRDPAVDYFDSISDHFRSSQRAVQAIHQKGVPVVEIPAILMIARQSKASPNQLIEARKSGKPFSEIAKQYNVVLPGSDFVTEANILFLSEYHGRPAEEIRQLRAKGTDFVVIDQEYRRGGSSKMPKASEPARTPKN